MNSSISKNLKKLFTLSSSNISINVKSKEESVILNLFIRKLISCLLSFKSYIINSFS